MADQQSNDTIRQMMAGFSSMQFNLGLLPMSQAQAMGGASQQFQTPPPPPQIAHPGAAAQQAIAQQQAMIQQTLQAAQVTRYQPPPSAPTPSVGAMAGFGAMNPFAASPIGGGGGGGGGSGGGGWGGGGGFAGPGAFAGGGGGGVPRLPSTFNPFAPTLPHSHFASPAMRNMQLMQHAQSQTMGTIAGIGEGAMGIGGSMIGGALGSAFGPLGTMAGAWLGGKVGGAISSMVFNPVTQDYARGRQVQQMTSPFMVTGSNLNMATGQGMDAQGSRQVATGIRQLARDHDFERTGFNTQDTMRIMQTSASSGLLTGAQSPDQIVQKVKDISKTVSVLMKITGDPDVRHAIQSLGQMREMGFQGLSAQAGAIAQRASYARMRGVSQATMAGIMSGSGEMATSMGMVGATGEMAGGFGHAAANVAASSGALGDIQMARAGGQAGLGRINTMGSLAALSGTMGELQMLAGSRVGKGGKLEMDTDAFRRAGALSFQDLANQAAEKLRQMQEHGIYDWNTRKNEMKDVIAQKLRPGEMQMMMLQQARSFQASVDGMTLGSALQKTTGLDANAARALEVQFQSRDYWQGMANQMRVQRRDVADQEKAHREEYRTPGLMTRMRRGVNDFMGDVSDVMSSPFRAISGHFDRVHEDDEAASRGERISRYEDADIAHDEGERKMLRRGLKRKERRSAPNLVDQMGTGGLSGAFGRSASRQVNRIDSFLGLSSDNDANKLAAVANYSKGRYTSFGETFGDPRDALARVKDVVELAQAQNGGPMSAGSIEKLYQQIGDVSSQKGGKVDAAAVIASTSADVISSLKDMKAGYIKSARAMGASDIRSKYIDNATKNGMSRGDATNSWEANKTSIMKSISESVHNSGDQKSIEVWEKANEVAARAGAVDLAGSDSAAQNAITEKLEKSGMGDISDKTMQGVKAVLANHDEDAIALATALAAEHSGNDEEKAVGLRTRSELLKKLGTKGFAAKQAEASALQSSLTGDVGDAFMRVSRGTKDLKGVQEKLQQAAEAGEDREALAARKEFKQKLDDVHKGAAGAGSVKEAVAMISETELDQLDSKTKDAILKYRAGGDGAEDALNEAVAKAAPTTKTTRHGGGSSEKLKELDEQIATYEDEAAKASGGMDPQSKLQSDSTDLFAKSVSDFATAVKDLKGDGENKALSWSNPNVMAQMFGGR